MINFHITIKKILLIFLAIYLLSLGAIFAIKHLLKTDKQPSQESNQQAKESLPPFPSPNPCFETKPRSFIEIKGKIDKIDNKSISIDNKEHSLSEKLEVYLVKSKPISVVYDLKKLEEIGRKHITIDEVKIGDNVSALEVCQEYRLDSKDNTYRKVPTIKDIYLLYIFRENL